MKKFWLLSFILLLAASCNNNSQKINQLQSQVQQLQNQLAKQQATTMPIQATVTPMATPTLITVPKTIKTQSNPVQVQ